MLKRTITYENPFTEQMVSEEHYFHISKATLVEMELEDHKLTYTDKEGKQLTGMVAKLTRIMESEDGKGIIEELQDMIRRSYGKKDGDRFLQSKAIWEDFASSAAYSQFRYELLTDASKAAEFISGAFPKNLERMSEDIRKSAEQQGLLTPEGEVNQEAIAKLTEDVSGNGGATASSEKAPTELTEGDEPRLLSSKEVADMDSDELKSGLATGKYKLS